jgi:hypothetical protein
MLHVLGRHPELCVRPATPSLECRLLPHLQWVAPGLIALGCGALVASAIGRLWRSPGWE